MKDLSRRLIAEFLGTAGLLAVVVGSGIMAERLAGGNAAVALLANALATGAGLVALITTFAGISGAHFNPVVSLMGAWQGALSWRLAAAYVAVQCLGGIAGVLLAHGMFGLELLQTSSHVRSGAGQWLSEVVATTGLLLVIHGCGRRRAADIPYAVAAYVTAGYWFTASTCFANPAVTVARACTDTFAGIRPGDVPGFILVQIAGLIVALAAIRLVREPT